MVVVDRDELICHLRAVSYYRLSAYWHPFKQADDSFKPGTQFDVVWRRYVFDRHLRLAVMDAIERVEVAVRSALMYELTMWRGPFAHTDRNNFPKAEQATYDDFLDEVHRDAFKSKEVFVAHFRTNYSEDYPNLPLWASAEMMTFGSMFTLFNMSGPKIQAQVAKRFGVAGPVLFSWLQTLMYIRNLCAHHGRLWNRELAIRPMIPNPKNGLEWHSPIVIKANRVFVVLTLLHTLLREVAPQTRWRERLFKLFDEYSTIPLLFMGIPADWRSHPLWMPTAPKPRSIC